MIKKIISGGQTGADRAALDVAIKVGIPHGGWIPKGRKTEDGVLPDKYQLQEMSTTSYPKRTEQNVLDSEGTLIVSHGKLNGGSALTRKLAGKHKRPCIHIDMDRLSITDAVDAIKEWIGYNAIQILNVAGPRASKDPDIYNSTKEILETMLATK
ncbi:MAG: putative molybdenum carrier protein [Syntrophales bacterium]|nr:putative molybdenum carrier protein [Syntrophales bacterium]